MTITRRVFVKSSGLALFSLGLDPLSAARLRQMTASTAVDVAQYDDLADRGRQLRLAAERRGALDSDTEDDREAGS